MINIIIVDDHIFFRNTLKDYLGGIGGVEVVAEAGNGLEAVEFAKKLAPQLVLMDIRMPRLNGVEACEIIKQALPNTRIVLYTMYEPEMYCQGEVTSADVCLPKDRLFDEIPTIIKECKLKKKGKDGKIENGF